MSKTKKDKVIFKNGKIFTSNTEQPYASAMVVSDGMISWIGQQEDLGEVEGEVVDLKGRRVLPGLIDAHLHPLYLANADKQIACTQPLVNSIKDLISEVRKQAEVQEDGAWIEGWGYDEGKLSEGRAPTRWDLDQATTEFPVVITRTCIHVVSVNSRALEIASITRDTPDPKGGEIDRDENGEPTGILRENAKDLVKKVMPETTLEEDAESLAQLSPELLSHGITAITDLMGLRGPVDYLEMYSRAREQGMKQRSVLYYMWEDLAKDMDFLDSEKTCLDHPVHIGGIKLFSDGSVSGQTAWVTPSFVGEDDVYGIQMTSEEELLAAAEQAKKHNVQLVIHAMGEQAIDLIVNTFYEVDGWLEDAPSVRIEHASLPTEQAIERAAKAGIAVVTQPIFLFAEIGSYINNLGEDRTKRSYPIRSMLDAGVPVAFSSDAPATAWSDPVNPFIGMQAAVTRVAYDHTDTGQEQRVDVETAITLYTRAAQHITRIPQIGQLTTGYYADFIVLDQDIMTIEPTKIGGIQVEETYMSGSLVYERGREKVLD